MATKGKSNIKSKGQEVMFAPGTRHSTITPSLATLTRLPLALPVAKATSQGIAGAEAKREFILGLLKDAGSKGLTWRDIQASLKAKYGQAPKKRAPLYALLSGVEWHKTTGGKGIVTYRLGKPSRKTK